ncbi:MAG: hypothetical protein ACOCW8_01500 [bacterium]
MKQPIITSGSFPKNEAELDLLKEDTTLTLYDIPLDHEIEDPGIYYHDPELPDTAITWQYCAVTVDHQLPDVYYEKLADLYIPPTEEDDDELKSSNSRRNLYENLEDEALRITNNLEEEENGQEELKGLFSRKSKWRPAGRITAKGKAIVGCMVRARRWFTTHKGFTDNNGNFSCDGRFRRKANYSIKWERYYWDIRSGNRGQAYYNGPKQKSNWNLNINSGKSLRYAFIHQAAYDYFYRNPFGTQKPFEKRWYRSTLKIGYHHKHGENKGADFAKWRNWITYPHIRIYKGQTSNASTTQIYASTIHELAHSAHWQLIVKASGSNRIGDFYFADKKLKESWAVGMQTLFSRNFIDENYDRYGNINTYTRNTSYSELCLELIETADYSVSELEQCLIGASNLDNWQKKINNKYNRDETTLANIFNRY